MLVDYFVVNFRDIDDIVLLNGDAVVILCISSCLSRTVDMPRRRWQTGLGPVLAARSPGLGNVDNLHEVRTCNSVHSF